jgi:hypothetical protein
LLAQRTQCQKAHPKEPRAGAKMNTRIVAEIVIIADDTMVHASAIVSGCLLFGLVAFGIWYRWFR